MRAVARRFGYGSLAALGVLLVTGWAMASHYDLFGDSTLQWKLGLVALVVALTLLHLRWGKAHFLQAAILLTTLVIVWLGLDLAASGLERPGLRRRRGGRRRPRGRTCRWRRRGRRAGSRPLKQASQWSSGLPPIAS